MPLTRDVIFWNAMSRATSGEPCFGLMSMLNGEKAAIVGRTHPGDEGRLSPSPYENLTRQQTQPRFRAAPA